MSDHRPATHTRLCILAETFYPSGGGVGSNGMTVSRELAAHHVPVRVLTRRESRGLAPADVVDGVRIVRLPPTGMPRFGKYVVLFPMLAHLIRERRSYDVIYVWGIRILGSFAVLAGHLLGKRVVLRASETGDMPGDFLLRSPIAMRSIVVRRLFALIVRGRNALMRRANLFVATSLAVHESYLAAGVPAEKIHRIPNGVDLDRFMPAAAAERRASRRRLGLPDGPLAVYAGRLHRAKGLLTLVRAWHRVVDAVPGAHLALVGGNSAHLGCEPELRELSSELGVQGAITFAGQVADVRDWLRAADCFVLPSDYEAFPLAVVEAMACGLPVVMTRTGGAELVREGVTGQIVPVGDPDALATALATVLGDADRAGTMGAMGRDVAVQEYAIDRAIERHLRMLEVVSGRSLGIGSPPSAQPVPSIVNGS